MNDLRHIFEWRMECGPMSGKHRRGRRHGGWPGGPPFRGWPGFEQQRHGGGRARRGDVRAALLALLAEEPRNGYQLMQEIEARSEGMWRPSPGSVYPALQQLEDEGLIRALEREGGRVYELTEAGRKYVDEQGEAFAEPWKSFGGGVPEDALVLLNLMRQIGMALWQIGQEGDERRLSAAREVLADTRRRLYAILAEDDEPEADEV
jgi:DNA-binding PadR family transcriptional regulator